MKRNITFTASRLSTSPKSYPLYTAIALLLMLISSVDSNAQSKDRDRPTRLTSNEISGVIDSDSRGNFYYYSFMAGPGEVSITLTVEPGRRSNDSPGLTTASFSLFDRNAEGIASKTVSTYEAGGSGQAVARVDIAHQQLVVLGINIPSGSIYSSVGGKYRVRINGAASFGQATGITDADVTALRESRKKESGDCLPKQGTLIVKMKDGSKKIIDLSEAEEVTIVP